MELSPIAIVLLGITVFLSWLVIHTLLYLHNLNRAASRLEEGDPGRAIPSSVFPILSKTSAHYRLYSTALEDLQKMEEFQQKMMAFEKREIAHYLERESLTRKLECQLEETRQANETISNLNLDLEQINVSLNEAINRLSALNQISRMLGMEHDKKQIYRMAVSLPAELLQAEMGHLLLFDKEQNELVLEYSQGHAEPKNKVRRLHPDGQSLAGWVALNRKPLLVEDFSAQDDFPVESSTGYERKTAISAPIMIKEELIGVISLINRKTDVPFTSDEKTLLTTIASEAAMAINNTLLLEKIQKNYFSMIQSLIVAVESKDEYTRGHSERVTQYSLLIAEQLGLGMEQLEVIQQAAALHDIGKITVELSILNKPTTLSEEEYEKIKLHPLIGYKILEPIDFDDNVKQAVLQHHEKLDGSGYPGGRTGDDILMEARVLAVADAFDAMTTRRPYREPLSIEEALAELGGNMGTQFDTDVVNVLNRIVHSMTSTGAGLMVG
jgi:putative nucleotidyltransferase with HDIG domain